MSSSERLAEALTNAKQVPPPSPVAEDRRSTGAAAPAGTAAVGGHPPPTSVHQLTSCYHLTAATDSSIVAQLKLPKGVTMELLLRTQHAVLALTAHILEVRKGRLSCGLNEGFCSHLTPLPPLQSSQQQPASCTGHVSPLALPAANSGCHGLVSIAGVMRDLKSLSGSSVYPLLSTVQQSMAESMISPGLSSDEISALQAVSSSALCPVPPLQQPATVSLSEATPCIAALAVDVAAEPWPAQPEAAAKLAPYQVRIRCPCTLNPLHPALPTSHPCRRPSGKNPRCTTQRTIWRAAEESQARAARQAQPRCQWRLRRCSSCP